MLPPEAGVPLIRRELTAGTTRGEIVVAQRLGVFLNEWDTTGGLDSSAAEAAMKSLPATGPMIDRMTSLGLSDGYTVETTLDPHEQPFLHDHQIDGTPLLPGVMGIEAFAEAALCMLPGWHVEAIEDVNFLAPFKFYRGEPRTVNIAVRIHPHGEQMLAECRLLGHRSLPTQTEVQATTHFTARVRLAKGPVPAAAARAFNVPSIGGIQAADIYRIYFHGPAYQVVDEAWWDGTRAIGRFANTLPPNHHPSERPTLMAPRLIELCFQTAGIWELGAHSRMGLPQHVLEVSLLREPGPAVGRLYAVVTRGVVEGTFDAEILDKKGNCYLRLTGYQTVTLPDAIDAQRLERLHAMVPEEALLAV